jgi:3-oxoacyl-[acyl-carrier protein] reductase
VNSTLRDRGIIVAGGAGGLGQACVRMLAAEGARVIASYARDAGRAAALAEIAEIIQADLTQEQDRRRLLDAAPALYGLVVCSGIAARRDDLLEESLAVNFTGPARLAREAAARMRAAGTRGAIVLVASMQAGHPFPGSTPYSAPKAALVHAARVLAKECRGPEEVRVNVVSPGVMEAGIALESIAAGKYRPYLENGAIPRYGQADDTARAVRFFLEPDNYVTGQVLTVDGGLTL